MTHLRHSRALVAALTLAGVMLLVHCGGGASGGPPPPPPPPPPPSPPTITTSALPDAIAGQNYNQALQATGGTPPYTWTVLMGSPPPGISLSSAGVLNGIPAVPPSSPASYMFNVQVQDTGGRSNSASISVRVAAQIQISTVNVPINNIGVSYIGQFVASGGSPPFHWKLAPNSSSLPSGLTLNDSGLVLGTPTQAGNFPLMVSVQDSGTPPQSTTIQFQLTITNNLVITTLPILPEGVLTRAYQQTLQALGGTAPYKWTQTGGTFPGGISLDSAGNLTGMPTASGNFSFSATVTDSASPPNSKNGSFSLAIASLLALIKSPLADGVVQSPYSAILRFDGGISPYTTSVTSGSLPGGVTLPSGPGLFFIFTGLPAAPGTFTFTVQIKDSSTPPLTDSSDYSIRVATVLQVPPQTLADGIVGQPYSAAVTATGGIPPYHWFSNTGGSIVSPGLTIDPNTGVISGTPTLALNNQLGVEVTDSASPQQVTFGNPSVHIAGVLQIATSVIPPLSSNSRIALTLNLLGGTGPFTWSLASGSPPPGLAFSSDGKLSGTPSSSGSFPLNVKVDDPGPPVQSATANFTLVISGSLGRNDTVATATPISNGTYSASISPFADPPSISSGNPDVDVYAVTASPGALVHLETFADRLAPPSPLDTVMEIVDSSGNRLSFCNDSGGLSFSDYTQPCLNDDLPTNNSTDSVLFLLVPANAPAPITFYVRIVSFDGSARPDYVYQLVVSGAN